MVTPTKVMIFVPLELPLDLVNQIDEEARKICEDIPSMLSRMLIDAYDGNNHPLNSDIVPPEDIVPSEHYPDASLSNGDSQ